MATAEAALAETRAAHRELEILKEKESTRAQVAEAKADEWEERAEAASSVAVAARHAREVAEQETDQVRREADASLWEAQTEARHNLHNAMALKQAESDAWEAEKSRLESELERCAAAAAVAAKEKLEEQVKRGYEDQLASLKDKVKTLAAKLADTMTTADSALADADAQAEENAALKKEIVQKQTEVDAVKAQVIALRAKLNKKEADLKEARGLATPARTQAKGELSSPVHAAVELSPRKRRPLHPSSLSNTAKEKEEEVVKDTIVMEAIDESIRPLVEEIFSAADPNGSGVLSFRDFARWASWDGQVLEWLDGATRALGASLDAKDSTARAKLGKVELGALLKAYRGQGRPLDSTFSETELGSLLRTLLQSGEAEADRIAMALHPLFKGKKASPHWLAVGTGTSLLCRGTQMEKLKAAFEMMDRAGTGHIAKETMAAWLQGVQHTGC